MIHPTPTPGRIVWYRGTDGKVRAAIIAAVNGDFNLNLEVFGLSPTDLEQGHMETITHADPEQEPGCLRSWHWMPYQIEQARKAGDERQLSAAEDRDADERRLRAGILDMALRTPGLGRHTEVLAAASAYRSYIEGGAASQRPAPGAAYPGYSSMLPHQQRVADEQAELDAKRTKLLAFIETPAFEEVSPFERERLRDQSIAMKTYSEILGRRIAAFRPG